jgi:hypothetical protein
MAKQSSAEDLYLMGTSSDEIHLKNAPAARRSRIDPFRQQSALHYEICP